ncbi:phytanoyl-CoA dioxygenase [Colwellia demingiae]|uniref:Phytanoyl-CoA dioxygenase n=1 Tax=Colwellia demingiae TaxID=89401 RepID=A0A5C6Q6E6_9GAMM|nr:phytanoyl-CoA dioxygenase family protein [Colwellia demingiae]TWX64358.1 phytanoyl-CoA dioxygenase [Colwellia demingiae]
MLPTTINNPTNDEQQLNISIFNELCQQKNEENTYPLAQSIENSIPIYTGKDLRLSFKSDMTQDYKNEFTHIFKEGPGVIVIKDFFNNKNDIDHMSHIFDELLKQQGKGAGDHFAKDGKNGRIWNVFEKSAMYDSSSFIQYYKNPLLQMVAQSWLGPNYQVTTQLNVIYPQGKAQQPHRDFHLGFQENEEIKRYPLHMQKMSQYLTLQGGIAHVDIPLDAGPTQLLPFSHQYDLGYLAWRDPLFIEYFKEHYVQLPLNKGDALFFNPALFHAGGENKTTNINRNVNLIQVSSAFSKPMETVDLYKIVLNIYPELLDLYQKNLLSGLALDSILTASCDAYSFPTNLDTDSPIGSLAPKTVKELTLEALTKNWDLLTFKYKLLAHQQNRQS